MLIFISLANIILAFLLIFFNWKRNVSSIFLFLMLLFVSVHSVLQSAIMNGGPINVIMFLFNNFSPLYFLIGPMLYLYVRGTLTDHADLKRKDLWHFFPAILVLINVAPYWFTSLGYKFNVAIRIVNNNNTVRSFDDNWLIPSSVNFVLRGALMLSYVAASMVLLYRHHASNKNKTTLVPKKQERVTFTWLKILVTCMLLAIFGYYSSSLILVLVEQSESGIWHTLFVVFNYICFIPLLIIPLALLTFPRILYGIPALHLSAEIKAAGGLSVEKFVERSAAEISEGLEENELQLQEEDIEEGLQESATAIMEYLTQKKPYLDKDFSMDKLAQALQLPRHHIYFCMNRVLKVKFPELRKQLRIQHAKELLEQGKNKTLSIEGIGIQSGFSSRSNFFTAFKSEVGCTPSEYLEKLSEPVN